MIWKKTQIPIQVSENELYELSHSTEKKAVAGAPVEELRHAASELSRVAQMYRSIALLLERVLRREALDSADEPENSQEIPVIEERILGNDGKPGEVYVPQ